SEAGLFDIPLGGKRFTRMDNIGSKLSKIDRFLISNYYFDRWLNSYALALPREFSDHSPLLLSNLITNYRPIPIKFYNTWLSHKDFGSVLTTSWATNVDFSTQSAPMAVKFKKKPQKLKISIKSWRCDVQSSDSAATVTLCNSLEVLDLKAETIPLSPNEATAHINIIKDLTTLKRAKILDLHQKEKVRRVTNGDENSRFFMV
ncbi:cytochrome P450, partial [Tanacetum coccineum]